MNHLFTSFCTVLWGCAIVMSLNGCEMVDPAATDILPSSTYRQTENVVIVVIDGARFSETWGDPNKQYIPYMAEKLAPEGVAYNWFYNDGPTYTNSGHTAVITGKYQNMLNDGSEFPRAPSIFQLYLEHTNQSPSKAQIITSKKKLHILADCTDLSWRGRFNPQVNAVDREDKETFKVAMTALKTDHPKLSLIHFKGPDQHGHSNNWNEYLNSIRETDQFVYEIWSFLQGDPMYQNRTALFVTNDHGRHLDNVRNGFVSHGDSCPGCLHINLYATGPDFTPDKMIDQKRGLIDIAPTVAVLLGFDLPQQSGSVLTELFREN